jgi:hypothetical protein
MSRLIPKIGICFLIIGTASLGIGQTVTQTEIAGGNGGSPFIDQNIPSGARVLEILISAGGQVDSLQMTYEVENRRVVQGIRHGSPGWNPDSFRLDSDEYVTGISGSYGQQIESMRIHTNKRASPIYGRPGWNREFRIDVPSGYQAVGFAGRSGSYINAIGLIYAPIILETTIYGGSGGLGFSDASVPPGARITEIRVNAGKMIDSIRAMYVTKDGYALEGPHHGGSGGRSNVLRMDPDEYITGISGRYGNNLESIVFRTNKRTSPKYGGNGGRTDFSVDVPRGSVAVGFCGRSSAYVDALGLTYTRTSAVTRKNLRRLPGRSPHSNY